MIGQRLRKEKFQGGQIACHQCGGWGGRRILPLKECDFHPDVFVLFPCNIVVKIR